MSQLGTQTPTFTDGRTKQSFRDETDINVILKRAQKTGTISHLNKYQGRYADFSDFDFQANQIMLAQGREIFDELPVELRNEFNQSQAEFFNYVNDPKNKDRLAELLPALAEPGRQNLRVSTVLTADEKDPEADPEPIIAVQTHEGSPSSESAPAAEPPSTATT